MKVLRKICKGMCLTFHRAFDTCTTDLSQTLLELQDLGVDRILTAGGGGTALEGATNLKEIVQSAKEIGSRRMQIIAGGSIAAEGVEAIITTANLMGIHAGSSVCGKKYHQNSRSSSFSSSSLRESFLMEVFNSEFVQWEQVEEEKVRELVGAANRAWSLSGDHEIKAPTQTGNTEFHE